MALNTKRLPKNSSNSNRVEQDLLPVGANAGRLVQIIDLGLQPQKPFKGTAKPPAYMVQVTYELSDEFMVDAEGNTLDDKPRWLSEQFPMYSLEVDRAKSTKRYNSYDPSGAFDGDFAGCIAAPVQILIVHNQGRGDNAGRTFANISDVMPYVVNKRNPELPELINKPVVFSLDEPDMGVFDSLPDWLKDKVKENLEFTGSELDQALNGKVSSKPALTVVDDSDDEDGWDD